MKKVFKSMFAVAVAALAFASCVKEEPFQNENDSEVEKVTIEINAEGADQTKTHMDGTNKVKWNKTGEALQVLEYAGNLVDEATKSYTVSDDLTTAKFSVVLPAKTAASFDYWGIYPAANFISKNNTDVASFRIELPDEQHPRTDSFDANADLLISSPVNKTAQPAAEGLDFRFHRPVAVVELTLVGIGKGEKIASVQFSNSSAAIAGRSYYDLTKNSYVKVGYQGQDKKIINALYKDFVATGEDKVYITTFPASLKDFTLVVTTDKATYTKEVPSAAIELIAGHKKPLKIGTFAREELVIDQYDLLTDVSVLKPGYRLLITNGSKDGSVFAMGPKVDGQNRIGTTSVTVGNSTISSVPADALVVTLEGTQDNYLLYTSNGYLSLNGTANELKYIASEKDASKWKISVAKDGNIDIISGTRPIRFNSTYFASYKGTSSCSPVYAFYKKGNPMKPLDTPANLYAEQEDEKVNSVTVIWDAVANAASYTVTCGDKIQTVNTTSATIAGLAWSATHTISVVANPADASEDFKSSEPATTSVKTGINPEYKNASIKDLRIKMSEPGFNIKSYCGGSLTAYVAALYSGNISIVDNTGEAGTGIVLRDYTGTAEVGQKISIDLTSAKLSDFNGLKQIMKAKISATNDPVVAIAMPQITAAELNSDEYQGMYVQIEATTPATAGTWGMSGLKLSDSTGDITIHVSSSASFQNSEFKASTTGIIKGIASNYNGTQLQPIKDSDVLAFADTTPKYNIDTKTVELSSGAATAATLTTVTANSFITETSFKVSSDQTWLTKLKVAGGKVVADVSENIETSSRQATVTVTYIGAEVPIQTITVTQVAKGTVAETVETIIFTDVAKAHNWKENASDFNQGEVSVSFTAGCPWKPNDKHVRIYSGKTMKVSAPAGKLISKVVFDIAKDGKNISPNVGTITSDGKTWTGSSQTISFKANGQYRLNGFAVYYE